MLSNRNFGTLSRSVSARDLKIAQVLDFSSSQKGNLIDLEEAWV